MTDPASNRRDFLTGRSLQSEIQRHAEQVGDALLGRAQFEPTPPVAGPTVRLSTRAMACEFQVLLNTGPNSAVETWFASDALDLVHALEDQMTVYRAHSELIAINQSAGFAPVAVEPGLFAVLKQAHAISVATGGAFDVTVMPLVRLWKQCRSEVRVPRQAEVDAAKARTGVEHVVLDDVAKTVSFLSPGIELQLNSIGKGYALDRAAEVLAEHAIENWLLHGGNSSVLAKGEHNGLGGWPVGIRNPLFPDERLATLLLKNAAMGTSGNSVQFYRHQGQRYGHILDPRSGWPADQLLQATVIAPTSAEADALSTAFFVMGLEKAKGFCQNRPDLRAVLIPFPRSGRVLEPVNCGISAEDFFLSNSPSVVHPRTILPDDSAMDSE